MTAKLTLGQLSSLLFRACDVLCGNLDASEYTNGGTLRSANRDLVGDGLGSLGRARAPAPRVGRTPAVSR